MDLLHNAVRPYAWGSRTAIAELLGSRCPHRIPRPSCGWARTPATRRRVVGAGRRRALAARRCCRRPGRPAGPARAERWGSRLPFLLKVLAAEEPLSLQAHPQPQQAARGLRAGRTRGVPRDAADRNYRDAGHKPELICALTEFHALAGFRDAAPHGGAAARARRARRWPRYAELLAGQPDPSGLRALFTTLDHAAADRAGHAAAAGARRVRAAREGSDGEFDLECRTVLELGESLPRRRGRAGRAAAQPRHAAAGRGDLPAGRQPARLPARRRRRDHGQLGQRAARRADAQARRRARSCCGCSTSPPRATCRCCAGAGVGAGSASRYRTPAPEFAAVARRPRSRPSRPDSPARGARASCSAPPARRW